MDRYVETPGGIVHPVYSRRSLRPSGEVHRILQVLTEATKSKSFKECGVPFGPHGGKIARGHMIPRAALKRLAEGGFVRLFTPSPGLRDIGLLPTKVGVGEATTGFFACETHEKTFWPIENSLPEADNDRHNNLLAYKALVGTSWRVKQLVVAYEKMLKIDPTTRMWHLAYEHFAYADAEIQHYKLEAEMCLNTDSCENCQGQECKRMKHIVRHIESPACLAVCEWFFGGDFSSGITIYPTDFGQTVAIHYFDANSEVVGASLGSLLEVSDRKFQELISIMALQRCENIAISPKAWSEFDPEKQRDIQAFFEETIPDSGFASIDDLPKFERHKVGVFDSKLDRLNLFER